MPDVQHVPVIQLEADHLNYLARYTTGLTDEGSLACSSGASSRTTG